jgi:phospholipid/cholesterol/gamma-HCH transport system permease protein
MFKLSERRLERDMEAVPRFIGKNIIFTAQSVGEVSGLLINTLYWIFKGSINWSNTVIQMVEVGWASFPVIGLTSLFTGMVLGLQLGASTKNLFNEPVYLGAAVGFSLVKELGPVLTSIVMSGRIGASIAAELGTMKVTEQIDALYTLGTNPVRYLVVPRFLACMVMIPILSAMANVLGILGGLIVSVVSWGIPSTVYWEDILSYMEVTDFLHGFIKTFVFAGIIATVSCYKGFVCEGGAEGVGKATTSAVMISMVLILVSDYFLTALLVAIGI